MVREKLKRVNRHEEKASLNGFDLTFLFEFLDEEMPKSIQARGVSENGGVFIQKTIDAITVTFNNKASYDGKLVEAILKEFAQIEKELANRD